MVYLLILGTDVSFLSWIVSALGHSNVCYKEKYTKRSSNTLLRLVYFSVKQTLLHPFLVYVHIGNGEDQTNEFAATVDVRFGIFPGSRRFVWQYGLWSFQTGYTKLESLCLRINILKGNSQFSKFNNFLWVCWFPIWKLHNPYCHTMDFIGGKYGVCFFDVAKKKSI